MIVVGSGGGVKIGSPAFKLGKKTALVERGFDVFGEHKIGLGGTCLNRGCSTFCCVFAPVLFFSSFFGCCGLSPVLFSSSFFGCLLCCRRSYSLVCSTFVSHPPPAARQSHPKC